MRAVMCTVLRAAALISLALVLVSPTHAACRGNCEPNVEVARAAMQQIFKQTFLSPYTLVSFERLDGRSGERQGGVLTVNWHDRSIAPERLWDDFYLDLLDDLKRPETLQIVVRPDRSADMERAQPCQSDKSECPARLLSYQEKPAA